MDKENKDTGHIKDTGGPYENLQAIVKCGTSEFLGKLQDASSAREMSERPHWPVLGFYLTFLVANKVVMTSKNNDGNHTQHNWESDESLLMRSPLRMTWWKRRLMLRRRRRKMMNEEGTVKEDNKEDRKMRKMRRQPYTGSCATLPN